MQSFYRPASLDTMSFTFSFDIDDSECSVSEANKPDVPENIKEYDETDGSRPQEYQQAREINIDWNHLRDDSRVTEMVTITDSLALKVVSSHSVESALGRDDKDSNTNLSKAITAQSDLIPQVYEGGLKIWECSVDLAQYMTALNIAFRGIKVLELGCGAGLPGLYAYTQGAEVAFQDFNEEVLNLVTAPNVLLSHSLRDGADTCDTSEAPSGCRFISGDWGGVQSHLAAKREKFDYILTSETIYSPESYNKLHEIMKALLKPSGKIFLAAKTYYFGVGGGTRDFEDMLDSEGVFDHKVCKEYTTGVQREILELTFKDQHHE